MKIKTQLQNKEEELEKVKSMMEELRTKATGESRDEESSKDKDDYTAKEDQQLKAQVEQMRKRMKDKV